MSVPVWYQRVISVPPKKRGCHLIQNEVENSMPEIRNLKHGLLHILIKHTSASIGLNENWDSDVRVDMEMFLNRAIPENIPYKHSCEGPDDMPAHIKAAFIGSNLSIPVTEGKLNLGTWQGLWLFEHRNHASSRSLVLTLQGIPKS
ncbi:Hypothetical predicted protein [Octopus vulgaris]|uniref:Uncharacterized protein n=1 Tax=Octopus vulgaris TaxID=6645 RepID=A0AA36B7J6_OCTVU|nr:Hypothetical predicted protein [Octopus vulgaris]